jgi:pilus assembly protein CpaC
MMTPNLFTSLSHLGRRVLPILTAGLMLLPALADAADVSPGGDRTIRLETNKGTVIRLDRPATTVFVADPEVVDIQMKSPKLVYLIGRMPGETTLYAADERENFLARVNLRVTHNLTRLADAVRTLHPEVNVNFRSIEDSIVLEGDVADPTVAEDIRSFASQFLGEKSKLLNRLNVVSPVQVNLRVRVAEINREVEKQLGFNWQLLMEAGGQAFAFATVNPLFAAGTQADQVAVNAQIGSWDVNLLLDVLEQEGMVSVLAEPNLTALTGETASFLAGGEFPILVPQGDNRVTVEFKKFGVSLAFTPTILGQDRINLHVRPEVSQLSLEGSVFLPIGPDDTVIINGLKTRRAETTVELGSGQSFAIAGLLSNDSNHDIKKFPGLGDIPILGRLFTSDRFQRKESELVIIATPYIVQPTSYRLSAPTDGFAPPNDLERLFPGGSWQQSSQPGPATTIAPDGRRIVGPVGFAID